MIVAMLVAQLSPTVQAPDAVTVHCQNSPFQPDLPSLVRNGRSTAPARS